MHRPQSIAESTPRLQLWLRAHGWQALALAVSYFVFGQASFLVQVDDVLVTPVLFVPEGIALAMALRFGAAVWPGVFVGQFALAFSRGLDPLPAASISAINSIEPLLAVFLFRAGKLDAALPRPRDMAGFLLIIFLVLQPFSATLGNATLWAGGIVERAELATSWLNWWIGNSLAQMLIAPLLLALFDGQRTRWQAVGDLLVPAAVLLPVFFVADQLLRWIGAPSLIALFTPILVLFAVYRGMASVCMAALLVSLGALYATSHGFGPFVNEGRADIPSLNLFTIGLALSGQFLAVFLRQARLQQKLADELRDTREHLQRTAFELTENIPVGTYVLEFDADGSPHFTFLSERFLAMTGLKREEVMANHALALQPMQSTDRSQIERLNREVFASKERFFWQGEITVRGEKRQVTLESIPRTRPGGGTIWEGVMTDITELKKTETKLRQANHNMRLAASAAKLGFWELDVKTGHDTWDKEMADIAGIALANFDGRWEKFVHPEDYEQVMHETRRMLESDEIFSMDYRILRPSGEVRFIREHGIVLRDNESRPTNVYGVWHDITEEKAASTREKELEAQHRRDLETKLKTSLAAAAVAHEINQPLSAILLQSKLALEKAEGEREALDIVAGEAQRVVTTIEKMKTLMRNVQTEHGAIDLSTVVRSALLYNKTMFTRHDVTVRESGLDKAHPIMGDDAQLQLAITNILRNAAEAIDESAADHREISVELEDNDSEVVLTIGDSGPGWSGAEKAEIPLVTTKRGGMGIGLYVARTAMENHRGKIELESSGLGGAQVRMIFPRGDTSGTAVLEEEFTI